MMMKTVCMAMMMNLSIIIITSIKYVTIVRLNQRYL